jgi:predicted nucleic acid-binding protein
MPLVIDASVAFKWFVPEVDDDRALALLDSDEMLLAPDLIFAEVANAMWVRLRKLDSGLQAVVEAQSQLAQILTQTPPARDLVSRASQIAFAINDSIYDCIYLALCERDGLILTTADEKLLSNIKDTEFQALATPL